MKKIVVFCALILSLLPSVVFASDISDALWLGIIRIANTGTASTDVSTVMTLDSDSLVTNNFANETLTDIAIQSNGADVTFMPGYGANPWAIMVPIIGSTQNLDYNLYTSGVTGGKIRYFPGATGMVVSDDPSLELDDDGEIEVKGYVDTSAGDGRYLVYKQNSLGIQNNDVETIRAGIINGEAWATPTGYTDPASQWTNETNAYDDNTVTYASTSVGTSAWGNYLQLSHAAIVTDRIRYWATREAASVSPIDIDAYYDSAWHDVYEGAVTVGAWATVNMTSEEEVSDVRVRFYNSHVGDVYWAKLHELDYGKGDFGSAVVTASDISSGEHTVKTDIYSPFLGIGVDTTGEILPVTDNLVFNAPMWQTECDADPFTSIDAVGHSCNVDGATWTDQGYSFDGTNDYINCGNDASIQITGNFAWEMWAYSSNWAGMTLYDGLACQYGDAGKGFLFDAASASSLRFIMNPGGGADEKTTSIGGLSGASWKDFVILADGTNLDIYVNGARVNRTVTDVTMFPSTANLLLGQGYTGGANFEGVIGEARYYDEALSPEQILQNYNATKFKYDGVTTNRAIYSTMTTVPDNGHHWTFFENDAMPYMESASITVAGTPVSAWEWEYDTTFYDSVGGNDASPSFRDTSSDADVSAELISFLPVSQAKLDSFTFTSMNPILTGIPGAIPQLYTDSDYDNIPGADAANELLAEGEIPEALWWFPFLFLGIGVTGLLAYGATRLGGGNGSLLVMCIVSEVLLALFGIMGALPFWPAILFLIPAAALIISQKHFSWG